MVSIQISSIHRNANNKRSNGAAIITRFVAAAALTILVGWRTATTSIRLNDATPRLSSLPVGQEGLFSSRQPNRTLVILMGNLRGGEKAWETLYKNVLDLNHADLALMVGRTAPENRASSLYDRAKYLWEFEEYDDWADALDLIDGTDWRTKVPPYLHPEASILGGVKMSKYRGSGGIIMMIRWFLSQQLQKRQPGEDTIVTEHKEKIMAALRTGT